MNSDERRDKIVCLPLKERRKIGILLKGAGFAFFSLFVSVLSP